MNSASEVPGTIQSVYAALLGVVIDKVEEDDSFGPTQDGLVRGLRRRHRVLVAGYSDSRPWPDTTDPISEAHRRVEIKFSFCRQPTDPDCSVGATPTEIKPVQ